MKIKNSNFLILIICLLYLNFNLSNSYIILNRSYPININTSPDCNPENCRADNGTCNVNKCQCIKCYATIYNNIRYNDKNNLQIFCNYPQSSSMTAAILELILPIGIGHFYRGSISFGIFKMLIGYIMFYGIYVIIIYYFIYTRTFNDELSRPLTDSYQSITVTLGEDVKKIKHIVLISQILFFILHLIDVYWLYTLNYLDGNQMPMC
jgi:hypothetical protein